MFRKYLKALVAVSALVLAIVIAVKPARAAIVVESGDWGTCSWDLTSEGVLTIHPGTAPDDSYDISPWFDYVNDITSIVVKTEDGKKVVAPPLAGAMFSCLYNVTSIDLSGLDTSRVTDMGFMFSTCSNLTSLDLSGFDTSNVTDISGMFYGCASLTSVNLSSFDTSNVTDMSALFWHDISLTEIDLSSFETGKVVGMNHMFAGCQLVTTLDLSNFDTAQVKDTLAMFGSCSALKTISVGDGWTTKNVTESTIMFSGCTSLVGGNGTKFSDSHTDAEYARIDTKGTPGYLTKFAETVKTGWQKIDGAWYYLDDAGKPMTNHWETFSGKWYYFGADGKLVANGWAVAYGKYYYIENYAFKKTGWVTYNGYYFYMKNYNPVVNDWVQYGSKWYYFNGSGVCTRVWP